MGNLYKAYSLLNILREMVNGDEDVTFTKVSKRIGVDESELHQNIFVSREIEILIALNDDKEKQRLYLEHIPYFKIRGKNNGTHL